MTGAFASTASDIARASLDEVLLGAPADRVLKRALRRHPELTNDARAFVADVVMGVACLQGRLRFQLHQAGLPHDVEHLISLYLVDERAQPAAFDLDVTRASLERTRFPEEPGERLATLRSVPLWLARRIIVERGTDEADALVAALNRRGPVTLRANLLKATREGLHAALAAEGLPSRAGACSPWALHLVERANIHGSPSWRQGLFEVQDEGSQLIALATQAKPGDVVIDYCAGRGGKSLALAAMLANEGRVIAHDVDQRRLDDLLPRRERAGASCIEIVRRPAELPEQADAVLVDAPCSETGALRRGPHKRWLLRERDVDALPALQLEILDHAQRHVRPSGALVYATCSVLKSENEAVVERFLAHHPRFTKRRDRTLLPHTEGTDGFHIAELEAHS